MLKSLIVSFCRTKKEEAQGLCLRKLKAWTGEAPFDRIGDFGVCCERQKGNARKRSIRILYRENQTAHMEYKSSIKAACKALKCKIFYRETSAVSNFAKACFSKL